ncbi:hypothetical protein BSKO_09710 [Bryopsis sp. KO-2023]|nr:hypothetical protein BSKO_09710 [Bryopsis sp. KO-2023]
MSTFSGCVRKWLLCCFPEADTDPWSVEASSRSAEDKQVHLAPISISVSTGLLSRGPGSPPPTQTVSFTATNASSTIPPSTIPPSIVPPSTVPSSTNSSSTIPPLPVPPSCPSFAHSDAERISNVVESVHLIADLMLDGTRPAAGGQPRHEGDLVASLELLQGCCRRSIPQPADSDYRRDLSHNTNPITRLLPASYPIHRLPQLEDPNFLHHHIDSFQQSVEPEVANQQGFHSSGDVTNWWYRSDDDFSFFSNQF